MRRPAAEDFVAAVLPTNEFVFGFPFRVFECSSGYVVSGPRLRQILDQRRNELAHIRSSIK